MTSEAATDERSRRGIRIYRAADAPDLTQTDFGGQVDFGTHGELKDVATALSVAARPTGRLLARQTPEEGGFSLLYLYFKPNFPLFRHKHETDCMYVVLSGSAVMGRQTLRAGDCFFVPAYAPYYYTAGPEGVEVLEIRHGVEGYTVIYTDNPTGRVEEAWAAIDQNAKAWAGIAAGPMMRANALIAIDQDD